MKKKPIIILLILAILVSTAAGAAGAANTFKYPGSKSSLMEVNLASSAVGDTEYPIVDFTVSGKHIALPVPALLMEEATYVPLRAVSVALGATGIKWADNTATVTAPGLTLSVGINDKYVVANGRYLYIPGGVKNVEGTLMIPIRTLCTAFGASVGWDSTTNSCNIVPGKSPIRSGDEYYDYTDLYWLSRIISAESRNQPLEGMIAVGTVVLNRVAAKNYPNTIYDVIFDFHCGVQFSPAVDGSVYNYPTEKSVIAAKLVLDGARECENCLYFAAVKDCWAAYNRTYVKTIGGHDFYA